MTAIRTDTGIYQWYWLTQAWEPQHSKAFFIDNGKRTDVSDRVFGNFAGLTDDRIKVVKGMGMNAFWFSPVYDADPLQPGWTYNSQDYLNVNTLFGSHDDLAAACGRVHDNDMQVIFDAVFNHTAKTHCWFERSRKRETVDGVDYSDFYVWQDPVFIGEKDSMILQQAISHLSEPEIEKRVKTLGREGLPALEVPLLDSKGQFVYKRKIDGSETGELVTVKLNPVSDWSKLITNENGDWIFQPLRKDGKIMYAPNNYIGTGGDRAWDYDEMRGQLYLHIFHDSMPDLMIGNPAVNNALIKTGLQWIADYDVDAFRLDAARVAGAHNAFLSEKFIDDHLAEAFVDYKEKFEGLDEPLLRRLFLAGITSNPPNTLRGLYQGWESPSPSVEIMKCLETRFPELRQLGHEDKLIFIGSIDVEVPVSSQVSNLFSSKFRQLLHPRDMALDSGKRFWQDFSKTMKKTKPGFDLLMEFGDDPLCAAAYRDAGAGDWFYLSTFDHCVSPGDLRASVENTLKYFPGGNGVNWTLDNHDVLRIMTRMGYEDNPEAQKLVLGFLSRLPGNVTVYNGTELGLDNPYGREVFNPGHDELNFFRNQTSNNPDAQTWDYGRAPYPWEEGYGIDRFLKSPESWNGKSYASQIRDPDSVLNSFRSSMQERIADPVLSGTGTMEFLDYADDVLVYARSNGREKRLFIDNFSGEPVEINPARLNQMNKENLRISQVIIPPYSSREL